MDFTRPPRSQPSGRGGRTRRLKFYELRDNILDNLATHKTQEARDWLTAHPRWRLVLTPKHASALNQVEISFSIPARRQPRHGILTGPGDFATQILAHVEQHNLTAKPFAWTHTGNVLAA